VFFLGNYIAHAGTVISVPGQSWLMAVVTTLLALFIPGTGILRGMEAIASKAVWAPTSLQTAARAGALCIVVSEREVEQMMESHALKGRRTRESRDGSRPQGTAAATQEGNALLA